MEDKVDDLVSKVESVKIEESKGNKIKENQEQLLSKCVWEDFEGISKPLLENILVRYPRPTEIQAISYEKIYKGVNLIAQSQNGSGKTLGFGIPTLASIDPKDSSLQAVIFEHTLEMITQTYQNLAELVENTGIKVDKLDKESSNLPDCHVLVTNVGQFCKYFYSKKGPKTELIKPIKRFVYDEADFILTPEINPDGAKYFEKVYKLKADNKAKYAFFTATLTTDLLKQIHKVVGETDVIRMSDAQLTLKNIKQVYYKCEDKINFLCEFLKRTDKSERMIIFVNTRKDVTKLKDELEINHYAAYILMGGEMTAEERKKVIYHFTKGNIQVLITTNVLARGFDEQMVRMVINYDLPEKKEDGKTVVDEETYLHRIGRTGRFGQEGLALNLITTDAELRFIKDLMEKYSSVIEELPSLDVIAENFKKTLENY